MNKKKNKRKPIKREKVSITQKVKTQTSRIRKKYSEKKKGETKEKFTRAING